MEWTRTQERVWMCVCVCVSVLSLSLSHTHARSHTWPPKEAAPAAAAGRAGACESKREERCEGDSRSEKKESARFFSHILYLCRRTATLQPPRRRPAALTPAGQGGGRPVEEEDGHVRRKKKTMREDRRACRWGDGMREFWGCRCVWRCALLRACLICGLSWQHHRSLVVVLTHGWETRGAADRKMKRGIRCVFFALSHTAVGAGLFFSSFFSRARTAPRALFITSSPPLSGTRGEQTQHLPARGF